jgi:hypothetical protein
LLVGRIEKEARNWVPRGRWLAKYLVKVTQLCQSRGLRKNTTFRLHKCPDSFETFIIQNPNHTGIMAGPSKREDNIEELLIDLKHGKRRVVSSEEPHLIITKVLTVPRSRRRSRKTESNKDIKRCRQNMLDSV